MKIAIFTDAFLPQVNGVVTATVNLAKGLADRGHTVLIIAPKYKNIQEFSYKNVKVKRISSIPAFFYEGFKFTPVFNLRLFTSLKKENIDIIHFQTPITLGLEAIIFSKMFDLPLVGTFHTLFADPEYLKHMKIDLKVLEKLSWKYARWYYNQCDIITCPSQSTKHELLENNLKRPIKVISNGINSEIFDNTNWKQVRKKYAPRGNLLLFVGRIAHEKNILYLLKCFRLLVNTLPETKLLLVGDGPQMHDVIKRIKELQLSRNVIVTGMIDHEKLIKSSIFKACDIFITASKTETQGITLLEAQANGLVCVALNAKGVNSLIKNNYNGYLVKDNDEKEFAIKVLRLLMNKDEYSRMKKNTLKEIHKHQLSHVIKVWEEEYIRLAKLHKHL